MSRMRKIKIKNKPVKSSLGIDLYALNQQLMAQQDKLDEEGIHKARVLAEEFFITFSTNHYFMLLCNEKKDYTVFHFEKLLVEKSAEGVKELMECIENRGNLKSLQLVEDKDAIEIWIDESVYYLFPYDNAVITL